MPHELQDCRVALLVAPKGTEYVEFEEPRRALRSAGARVTVLGLQPGEARTVHGDLDPGETVRIDAVVGDVDTSDFDALVIPGGTVGADKLRADEDAVAFVRSMMQADKPAGVICHGPWVLVEADVVRGRTLTSYPSLRTDVRNAGGTWRDAEVVRDGGLVTSRKPDDLPAFCDAITETFATGARRPGAGVA